MIADKVGALAALGFPLFQAERVFWAGAPACPRPPTPIVFLLAVLCVCVMVPAWWATPFGWVGISPRRPRRGGEPPLDGPMAP